MMGACFFFPLLEATVTVPTFIWPEAAIDLWQQWQNRIPILYAAPAGKTETFCSEIVGWRKPLFTFASDLNQNLITLGAKPLNPKELGNWNDG